MRFADERNSQQKTEQSPVAKGLAKEAGHLLQGDLTAFGCSGFTKPQGKQGGYAIAYCRE